MEMYKDIERSNQNDFQKLSEFDTLQNNYDPTYSFMQKPKKSVKSKSKNKKNKKKGKKLRIRKRKIFKDPVELVKESWLKISSPMFKHTGKYPHITLPNDTEVKVKCNKDYFRINESYSPANTSGNTPPSKLFFWFRLNGKNLYYAHTKTEMNVLGNISFRNVVGSLKSHGYDNKCFKIKDREQRKWTLCAESYKIKAQWICAIKTMLGYTKVKECKKENQVSGGANISKTTVITRKVTEPIILIPLASKKCNEGWDYLNKGQDWNCECQEGKEQSPINLPPKDKAILSPIKPIFEFTEVQAKQEVTSAEGQHETNKYLTIKNKHNTLRIKHKYFGKTVTLDGAIYTAEEIVFHTPSEHQINGKHFEMEMQVIHYGKTRGDIAKQLVLSFLFKKHPGVYNKFIDDLDFFNLPNTVTKKRAILNSLFIPKIFYNTDFEDVAVMKPFSFYTYQGSLTAPPCSERTIHYVAAEPIKIGSSALELFQEAIRVPDMINDRTGDVIVSGLLPENNRAVQKLNGRAVFYFDKNKFCGKDKDLGLNSGGKGKKRGHYEKVLKKITDYYYVNGEKPSGLPGSYVVSSKEANGNTEN
jgi:carbonic anhydrase